MFAVEGAGPKWLRQSRLVTRTLLPVAFPLPRNPELKTDSETIIHDLKGALRDAERLVRVSNGSEPISPQADWMMETKRNLLTLDDIAPSTWR